MKNAKLFFVTDGMIENRSGRGLIPTFCPQCHERSLPRGRSTMQRIQWTAAMVRFIRPEFLFLTAGSILIVWIAYLF